MQISMQLCLILVCFYFLGQKGEINGPEWSHLFHLFILIKSEAEICNK